MVLIEFVLLVFVGLGKVASFGGFRLRSGIRFRREGWLWEKGGEFGVTMCP